MRVSDEEVTRRCAASSIDSLLSSESALAGMAMALGAESVGNLSGGEAALLKGAPSFPPAIVHGIAKAIKSHRDPLGDAFCEIRTAEDRRAQGAVYTPPKIVQSMFDWAESVGTPDRVVELGAGSARFLMEAVRRFPKAEYIAVESNPLAALMARANLATIGKADQATVTVGDFRKAKFDVIDGRTLYIGNPPYVRHHLIDSSWKAWLKKEATQLGLKASQLAGLYMYFFLAIARWAKAGDYGALITAAEWMDVNYGQLVRGLFLNRLGGQSVFVSEPDAEPFPGTAATGAITTFTVNGKPPSARFARIATLDDLNDLSGGRRVRRERLSAETRWSHFTRKAADIPEGYVELGELCRVHRGQVTGSNRVWIAGPKGDDLPDSVLFPTVTKAIELIRAGLTLTDAKALRRVIDLPVDLDGFSGKQREAIEAFLKWAKEMGASKGYVATHRKAWWSVGLRNPAPILATYMARRPPSFVLNRAEARHLNIAHGLYPRERMEATVVEQLARYLRGAASMRGGRVYAGGLTKFEPREMERIPVPEPTTLLEMQM